MLPPGDLSLVWQSRFIVPDEDKDSSDSVRRVRNMKWVIESAAFRWLNGCYALMSPR